MSDPNDNIELSAETSSPASAGELLRTAREAAGLHIAALAVMLKVPVKKLEALESDRFDLLADIVFVRALASSVCRTLKINPAPILAQLPATSSPKLNFQRAGINEEFRSPSNTSSPSVWALLSKPAVLAGLALLLGALVLIFLPAVKQGMDTVRAGLADAPAINGAESSAAKNSEARTGSQAEPQTAATGGLAADVVKVYGAMTAQTAIGSATAANQADLVGSNSATSTMTVAGNTAAGSVVGAASPSDIVVFTATGESWVEATDAKGRVVLRRMLAVGDVVGAAGALPLKIVVGKANVTQVQIRGEGFDLGAVSKDNVARFEVK